MGREERAGAVGTFLGPIFPMLPLPDGTIGQADRQQAVGVYPGILAGEYVPKASGQWWIDEIHYFRTKQKNLR